MYSSVKVRMYPSIAAEAELLRWLESARFVYNTFLAHRIKAYKRRGESPTYNQQSAMLTRWRARDPRMRAVPRMVQNDALARLDRAFKNFYRGLLDRAKHRQRFPRFKSRNRIRSVGLRGTLRWVYGNKIRLPRVGRVPIRGLRELPGKIKELRITVRAGRWYVGLVCDDGLSPPAKLPVRSSVGLDLGVINVYTLSNGEVLENPRLYEKARGRLRRAHRRISRKQKGSHRRAMAVRRWLRLRDRLRHKREDSLHKAAASLVQRFDLIAVESFNLDVMMRGRFGRQFAHLGWGFFLTVLSFKAERAGKTVRKVYPRNTSQVCSGCGEMVLKRKKVRVHRCPKCGLVMCRDVNAARNILALAVAAERGEPITRGEMPLPGLAAVAS